MNTDEMKDRFKHLYDVMKDSNDVDKMKIFGCASHKMFNKMAMANPAIAKEWIDMLEPIVWNNYLTEEMAEQIAQKLVNQDQSKGPLWSMDTFFSVVPKLGGKIEDEPYYNKYALWLVANAHYSDFAQSTSEDMGYTTISEVPGEKMALSMYKKAVESLKDIDRSHYIADYYHV
ncbi:MAG: hypothetical protein IJ307_05945 [Bacteroidales bacterium]|nr:hypothetical protein [Bacteroidales bacterium]